MNEETRAALEESIKHWEEVVKDPWGVPVGSNVCALCKKFILGVCTECPVMQKTGLSECRGTPFRNFLELQSREAAQEELDFLKSLRPAEENSLPKVTIVREEQKGFTPCQIVIEVKTAEQATLIKHLFGCSQSTENCLHREEVSKIAHHIYYHLPGDFIYYHLPGDFKG